MVKHWQEFYPLSMKNLKLPVIRSVIEICWELRWERALVQA